MIGNEANFYKNTNEKNPLKESAIQLVGYLDSIVEETFDLKSRKEYYLANMSSWMDGMKELVEREENLGVHDSIGEEKFQEIHKEFKDVNKIIEEDAKPEKELNAFLTASDIRNRFSNITESKIYELFGIQVESWESFVMYLNLALEQDPFYWDSIKEKIYTEKDLWIISPDSKEQAKDFDGRIVSEENWTKAKIAYLGEELAQYDEHMEGFKEKRLNLIKRIEDGERTQELWNEIMNLA